MTNIKDFYRDKQELEYLMEYEKAVGIHTYHYCEVCGENTTRRGVCLECLKREYKEEFGGNFEIN